MIDLDTIQQRLEMAANAGAVTEGRTLAIGLVLLINELREIKAAVEKISVTIEETARGG